jgi:uncharacterized oxidoreductase
MPSLDAQALERLATAIFERSGAPADHARCVAEHLVGANLAGHDSHGVLRIPQYCAAIAAGRIKPAAAMRIVQRMPAGAVVDGGGGFGQVVARDAMLLAIEIARASGMAAVAIRNCSHTGRIGTYTQMAAQAGLIGIAVSNTAGAGQAVVPFGGAAPRLSTNPISIAAPSGGPEPILLDMATSVAPEGKVRAHYQAGKSLPPGWIIDAAGKPSTNPADFYNQPRGSLLPLGAAVGYKGFGLAFMIDILAGALSGAGCSRPDATETGDGMLVMAIDARQFAPFDEFQHHVAVLAEHVRSTPPAAGFERVYIPGDVEMQKRERRLREGIAIDPATWQQIVEICRRLEIDEPAGN